MTMLGEGWALSTPEPAPAPPEEDLLALRLELVLTALDGLAQSLKELPTPQVFIDAPDLSAIVQAVNGLKPGADADDIAQAVVRQIAPTAQKPEPDAVYSELVTALQALDFRLQGAGSHTAAITLPNDSTRLLGHVTVDAMPPVTVDTTLLAKDATLTNGTQHTVVDNFPATQTVAGSVSVSNLPATQTVTGTVTVGNFPATQPVSAAALPLPAGAAQDATLTGGNQIAQVKTAAKGTTAAGQPTSVAVDANTQALHASVTNFPATQPVSGTFWQATQPVSLATNTPDVTDRSARLLGHVTVDNASIPVTGTFWQATQPVSLAATVTVDTELPTASALADAAANPTAPLAGSAGQLFNGTSWDQQRGMGLATTTGDTGAKTASGTGATQTNVGNKGVQVVIALGVVTGTTPTCVFKMQGSLDGTTFYDIPGAATASLTATNAGVGITVYPAATAVTGTTTAGTTAAASQPLPRFWRVAWTIGGTLPSFTITSITYGYLVN